MKLLIDWLEYTLLDDNNLTEALSFIGCDPERMEELPKGGLGYKSQLYFNYIRAYFNGNKGMGVHIQASGKGCRYLEAANIDLWDLIINLSQKDKINLTRVDIALDTDFDILSKLLFSINNKLMISKSRSIRCISQMVDGQMTPQTLYFGSRSSDIMIRVYDKAQEQGQPEPWYRIEAVLKKDRIYNFVPYLQKDKLQAYKSLLYTYIRPLEVLKLNKSRSPPAQYWLDFLGAVDKISLFTQPEPPTIEGKFNWLEKQCSHTMAVVAQAFGSHQFLDYMTIKGNEKLTENDYKLIAAYQRQGGLK